MRAQVQQRAGALLCGIKGGGLPSVLPGHAPVLPRHSLPEASAKNWPGLAYPFYTKLVLLRLL